MSKIPKLRFKEFSGEWIEEQLGDIVTNKSQKYNSEKDKTAYKCIELEHLAPEIGKLLGFSESIDAGSIKNKFSAGDVLFGKLRPYLKKYLQPSFDGVCSSEIWVLKGTGISNNFLFSLIQTKQFIDLANQSSGSKMPRADWSVVSNGDFYIPQSEDEQQKIATFLSAVDTKINQLARKNELLEQYRKGVMQKIFSQELRFKDDDGSKFPDWEKKRGDKLFKSISNRNHNSDLPVLAISQEHGAIPRELINYQISVTDKSIDSYKIVDIGDFIISLRSFQGGIEYSNYKGICSPAYIVLQNSAPINNLFYKSYFKTEYYIQRLCEKLEGIRDGKMISYKYFSEIEIPYPSLPEQTKIANFLSAIDTKIDAVVQQLNKAKNFKKALLQQMLL